MVWEWVRRIKPEKELSRGVIGKERKLCFILENLGESSINMARVRQANSVNIAGRHDDLTVTTPQFAQRMVKITWSD